MLFVGFFNAVLLYLYTTGVARNFDLERGSKLEKLCAVILV